MPRRFVPNKQPPLLEFVSGSGSLIFATGPKGISANIVGRFLVQPKNNEDLLCMGEGIQHIHVDWRRVRSVKTEDFHGEGLLIFLDGDQELFRLYRPAGPYSQEMKPHLAVLIE